jgi:hypothetical protein
MNYMLDFVRFISVLEGIWYLVRDDVDKGNHGAEDADANGRRFGVARHDVTALIKKALPSITSPDALWYDMVEDAQSIDPDERHYAASADSAYQQAEVYCTKSKHITLHALVTAFQTELSIGAYCKAAQAVATALTIDTDDIYIAYWEEALNDGLTPYQAVLGLMDE